MPGETPNSIVAIEYVGEPRIVLLASATSRFDEIDSPDRALYDLLRVLTLRPLDTDECAALWKRVSGRRRAPGAVRALQILTGGSPRLIAIVAHFGAGLSFRELMANLLNLVDDHTEYFKSHLEALPAQERRVYLALAGLWKPASAREIADRVRIGTSQCSAQLARLITRGAVETDGGARRKLYYLTERLFNIYYLLRRSPRGQAPLVEALVHFMESYYSGDTINHRYWVHMALLDKALILSSVQESEEELATYDEAARRLGWFDAPDDQARTARALLTKGFALSRIARTEEGIATHWEMVRRFEMNEAPAIREMTEVALFAIAEFELRRRRYEQAIEAAGRALDREDEGSSRHRWRGLLIRARATLEHGTIARDVDAALAILPTLGSLPEEVADELTKLCAYLGLARTRELIVTSPAADLLLPFTTALALELGIETRVAREVEEVAQDIRNKHLATLRNMERA